MKRLLKFFTNTAFAVLFLMLHDSCSNSVDIDLEGIISHEEISKISACLMGFMEDLDSESFTRTTLVTDVENNLQLVWAENDTIGIFPSQGNQVAFSMAGGAGQKNASFDGGGWGLKSEYTYSAYYPLVGEFYLDKTKIPLVMHSQTQKGNGSFAHVGKADYMAAVNSVVSQNGNVNFNFQPLTCLLRMQIKMPHGGSYNFIALETSGEFVTEATLDLATGEITPIKKSPLQVLTLKDVELDNNEDEPVLDFYLSLLPVDLTGKVISAKIFDENNNCYTATMQAKAFEAGTIYTYKKVATADLTHTGLPVVLINTPENVAIVDKENYVKNTLMSVLQSDVMDEFCELTNIKGRGNTTWEAPKKPYAIKFDKKNSLLSLPEDKSWVLLANYYDVTLLRNDLAFFMGSEMSNLGWTPHFQQVDLMLNGEYKGIYQLGEKVKISKKRVNVGDDGFLLEVDAKPSEEDVTFRVSHISQRINIKEPEVEVDGDDYNYIKDFMETADAALFSDNFLDEDEGYKNYIDMDSFVEWYLVNEISKNNDAVFYTSCYMNLKRGGKLKMGPLWDFDVAFGGYWDNERGRTISNVPENFYIKDVLWIDRMFQDPAFTAKVKERFNKYYANRQQIYDHIDTNATIIKTKICEENKLWEQIGNSSTSDEDIRIKYQEKVDYLKAWIETRFNWLYEHINAL